MAMDVLERGGTQMLNVPTRRATAVNALLSDPVPIIEVESNIKGDR